MPDYKKRTTQATLFSLNIIGKEKDLILVGFGEVKDTAFETGELEAEARQLNGEMNVAAELIQKCIGENACVAQNQGEYGKRYECINACTLSKTAGGMIASWFPFT